MAQIAETNSGHKHEFVIEFGEPRCLESPSMHLNPLVLLVIGEVSVVHVSQQRIGRRDFEAKLELGTVARIDGLAHGVARKHETITDEVVLAVANVQEGCLVVVQIVTLHVEAMIYGKIVVRPSQAATQANGAARHVEIAVVFGSLFHWLGIKRLVKRDTERIGPAATEPRFGERNAISDVLRSKSAHAQAEFLSVANGNRSPCLLVEKVAHGEIGKL